MKPIFKPNMTVSFWVRAILWVIGVCLDIGKALFSFGYLNHYFLSLDLCLLIQKMRDMETWLDSQQQSCTAPNHCSSPEKMMTHCIFNFTRKHSVGFGTFLTLVAPREVLESIQTNRGLRD